MNMPTEPTVEERLAAMEMFLQHLVLLMEVEPEFSSAKFIAWLQLCLERMRAHGSVPPRLQVALGQLAERVLAPGRWAEEPNEAAKQAANAALQKALRRRD